MRIFYRWKVLCVSIILLAKTLIGLRKPEIKYIAWIFENYSQSCPRSASDFYSCSFPMLMPSAPKDPTSPSSSGACFALTSNKCFAQKLGLQEMGSPNKWVGSKKIIFFKGCTIGFLSVLWAFLMDCYFLVFPVVFAMGNFMTCFETYLKTCLFILTEHRYWWNISP